MTSYQEKIRTKLQNKIFGSIGRTGNLINKSSPIYNSRGDVESYSATTTEITFVPYNITSDETVKLEFGEANDGSMDVALPYDTVINLGDTIELDGVNFRVEKIHNNYLPDNVVIIARLIKDL